MFDFRLKVLYTVAKRLNFTKAAEELNITQPAVTKHIKEIERQLDTKIFNRNGTKIALTASGKILLKYAEQFFAVYRDMEFEIHQLKQKHKGSLRLGASTTISQYLLPPVLAGFHEKYRDIRVSLAIQNTEVIEGLLANKKIDLGLIEGRSKSKLFKYTPFIKDEIVLVARSGHPLAKKNSLKTEDLKKIPLIFREPGSGTLEIILFALKPFGIRLSDLTMEMQLGNTESIKSYLLHSDCLAFISIHAILEELKNKTLTIIDVKGLSIERHFYFIQQHGAQSAIADLFQNFVSRYNFK